MTNRLDDREVDVRKTLGIDTSSNRNRHFRRWLGVGCVGLLMLPVLVIWSTGNSTDTVQFKTQTVQRGSLTVIVTATGTLEPTNQVEVGSELSGIIKTVEVDYNDRVKVGQMLAKLDTSKLEAQVLQSKASLASARAKVLQAQATITETRNELARMKDLRKLNNKAVSQHDLDAAQADLERALADEAGARASVSQAQATLELNETDLSKAAIRSPINGVVLERSVEPGQTVAASLETPVLFTLAEDLTQMELHVGVDEADVGQVKEGQKATFTVDAYPDRRFPAQISQVRFGSTTENKVVTYTTVLKVENSDLSLRPGMTATADIVVKRVEDAILVPNAALRFTPPAKENKAGSEAGSIIDSLLPRPPRPPAKQKEEAVPDKSRQHVRTLRYGQLAAVSVTTGSTDGTMVEIVSGDVDPGVALVVDTVTKVYGRGSAVMRALRGIDLIIERGEFVAVMGPSGSGKSTCMNILGCLDTPTTGTFLFEGMDAGKLSRDQRALLRRHYLGFVFQGFNLLNRTSALENVELPLIYRSIPVAERRARAMEALDAVGLKGWESHTPGELSGGQQQRVAIARAIVSGPKLLLADEPTGNLDSARSREVMELLTGFNKERGITVVMVTHEPDMAEYAERQVQFRDGLIDDGGQEGQCC